MAKTLPATPWMIGGGEMSKTLPWSLVLALLLACARSGELGTTRGEGMKRTDQEWREILTPEQYHILREAGTERAFTGALTEHFDEGVYRCAGCDQELFPSQAKFRSDCGWPAFSAPQGLEAVTEHEDLSLGARRIEIRCSQCEGHLGHVFKDGPGPTRLRYCINSAALAFQSDQDQP